MPNQFTPATMEGRRTKGRPRKRCIYEVEKDVNIMAIKKQAGNG
jgi:hypothetical protein